MRIRRLEDAPRFADLVADRIWNAWWRDAGVPRSAISDRLAESIGAEPVPTTFVALRDDTFLGTVSLILSDLDERPDLTPWIAALWVEPGERGRGIGGALVEEAVSWAARHGIATVHLAAETDIAGWYEQRGWGVLERDVGGLVVLARATGA